MDDKANDKKPLSPALEDYLETIAEILQRSPVARVKEIADRSDVKMASVSAALKRLSGQGLVKYSARAYVELTERGRRVARKVRMRHEAVERFFVGLLGVSPERGASDACAIEHCLSEESLDRVVRWLELEKGGGVKARDAFARFRRCAFIGKEGVACGPEAAARMARANGPCEGVSRPFGEARRESLLSDLEVGESAEVLWVRAKGDVRLRLLGKGFLPTELVTVTHRRVDLSTGKVCVSMRGEDVWLSFADARYVVVLPSR